MRSGPLTVTWVPDGPEGPPRVAYAIGKRVGGAVERNRLRRRLRSLVVELAPQLGSGAYLIGAAPEAVSMTHGELQSSLTTALQALHGRP